MADKVYVQAHWYLDRDFRALRYIPAGHYAINTNTYPGGIEGSVAVPEITTSSLIEFLDANGYIKPRLDTRLREEDLKITHRLIDLLDKSMS